MDRKGPLKIAMTTLGCKVNQSDASSLAADLKAEGHEIVSFSQVADAYIIHTCTVTQKTDYQSRQLIRRALRKNPDARMIVTGCYAQTQPEALKAIPGVDFILGVSEQEKIPGLLRAEKKKGEAEIFSSPIETEGTFRERKVPLFLNRNRAFLKVQDGCNSFCSYCIVPYTRGRSRSLPLERGLLRAHELLEAGFQEIVLTGIHLGDYGEDLSPSRTLLDLLRALEEEYPPLRLRLSSIEPREFSPKLIEYLSRSKIVCPHLHIPLQSGDDEILRSMNRDYSSRFFEDLVGRLMPAIPDLAIGIDVIGGFPGEGTLAFQNTVRLINSLPIAYLHVFPFSRRKGTPAATFPGQVPSQVIRERCQILRDLGRRKREAFYASHLGRTVKVLAEGQDRESGYLKGYSPNYIPILIAVKDDRLLNRKFDVQLVKVQDDTVLGIPES
jgi:threonylcarbamoyladenosine tRNA methylthiotransferase MtaB